MINTLKITSVQENPVPGDIKGNLQKAEQAYQKALEGGSDLVVFSELFILGYPAEDLVMRPAVLRACKEAVETLALVTKEKTGILIGAPWVEEKESEAFDKTPASSLKKRTKRLNRGRKLYNAILLLQEGKVQNVSYKHSLPNYGVFDENRVFIAGGLPEPILFRGISLGLMICEDLWSIDVARHLQQRKAEILISINASPYRRQIARKRLETLQKCNRVSSLPLVYVNQLGGQDELVFDGASLSVDASGKVVQQLPDFESCISTAIWKRADSKNIWYCSHAETFSLKTGLEADYAAILQAIRDYVQKNGFKKVILGLSGGIDSALVATLCVDALGEESVETFMLSSEYTSKASFKDAELCAGSLRVSYKTLSIEALNNQILLDLAPLFAGKEKGTTEENLQARLRGVLLMAISNKSGHLLMTTGNKSEIAIGYTTLYGDMCGAYNPLKDLYKTEVYALAAWRNQKEHWRPWMKGKRGEVIPTEILTKAPSAELKLEQTDQDNLPAYGVLDQILRLLIEEKCSVSEIVGQGFPEKWVSDIENKLYQAEHKRFQSAPGVKLGLCALGRDWRYPITHRYRSES